MGMTQGLDAFNGLRCSQYECFKLVTNLKDENNNLIVKKRLLLPGSLFTIYPENNTTKQIRLRMPESEKDAL